MTISQFLDNGNFIFTSLAVDFLKA